MNIEDVLLIYAYNDWADERILEAAAKVTPEQFLAPGSFPWGGLRGRLVHTLDAEFGWRLFFERGSFPPDELKEADFPGFDDLQQRWQREQESMHAYLATLDDAAIESVVSYISKGIRRDRVLWHCLYHVVNHGTQHRSESAALLTSFGRSPGDVDFTLFLSERAKRPA